MSRDHGDVQLVWVLFLRFIFLLFISSRGYAQNQVNLVPYIAPSTAPPTAPPTVLSSVTYIDVLTTPRPMTCLTGWALHKEGRACFKVNRKTQEWQRARQSCHVNGGHLAIIPDLATHQFLKRLVPEHGARWIGLRNLNITDKTGTWINGREMNFTKLHVKNSDNPANDFTCGAATHYTIRGLVWRPVNCSIRMTFICQQNPSTSVPTTTYACPPDPWVAFPATRTCFTFSEDTANWTMSRQACQANGSDLARVPNSHTDNFVKTRVRNNTFDHWLGLHKFDDASSGFYYYWLDDTTMFSGWHKIVEVPDVAGDCVLMDPADRMYLHNTDWKAVDCSTEARYVCQRDAHEVITYKHSPDEVFHTDHDVITQTTLTCPSTSWSLYDEGRFCLGVTENPPDRHMAAHACQELDSHLVKIPDHNVSTFINDVLDTGWLYWIGLNDIRHEKAYVWHDGTPLNFSQWYGTEPSESTTEDCVGVLTTNRCWLDISCNVKADGGICQYDTTTQEAMEEYIVNGLRFYISTGTANASYVEDRCADYGLEELLFYSDRGFKVVKDFLMEYVVPLNTYAVWVKTISLSMTSYNWNDNRTSVGGQRSDVWRLGRPGYPYDSYQVQLDLCTVAYPGPGQAGDGQGALGAIPCHSQLRYMCVNRTDEPTTEAPTTTTRAPGPNQPNTGPEPLPKLAPTSPLTPEEIQEFRESLGFLVSLRDDPPNTAVVDKDDGGDPAPQTKTAPPNNLCPCACRAGFVPDFSPAAIQEMIASIQKALKVDTASLSSTRNKKESAPDERSSSQSMGVMAVLFLVFPAAFILLIDVIRIYQAYEKYRARRLKVGDGGDQVKDKGTHEANEDEDVFGPFEPFTYA